MVNELGKGTQARRMKHKAETRGGRTKQRDRSWGSNDVSHPPIGRGPCRLSVLVIIETTNFLYAT